MDLTGLIGNILLSAADIDKGRKNLATDGFEHIGRIYYEDGISLALTTFKNAQDSAEIMVNSKKIPNVLRWSILWQSQLNLEI